jgi:hypothetical protein
MSSYDPKKVKDHKTNISTSEYKHYTSLARIYEESVIDVFNDVPLELFPRWLVCDNPFIRKCAKISYDKRVVK